MSERDNRKRRLDNALPPLPPYAPTALPPQLDQELEQEELDYDEMVQSGTKRSRVASVPIVGTQRHAKVRRYEDVNFEEDLEPGFWEDLNERRKKAEEELIAQLKNTGIAPNSNQVNNLMSVITQQKSIYKNLEEQEKAMKYLSDMEETREGLKNAIHKDKRCYRTPTKIYDKYTDMRPGIDERDAERKRNSANCNVDCPPPHDTETTEKFGLEYLDKEKAHFVGLYQNLYDLQGIAWNHGFTVQIVNEILKTLDKSREMLRQYAYNMQCGCLNLFLKNVDRKDLGDMKKKLNGIETAYLKLQKMVKLLEMKVDLMESKCAHPRSTRSDNGVVVSIVKQGLSMLNGAENKCASGTNCANKCGGSGDLSLTEDVHLSCTNDKSHVICEYCYTRMCQHYYVNNEPMKCPVEGCEKDVHYVDV